MKKAILLLLIFLFSSISFAEPPNPPFRLIINPDKQQYDLGEEIKIGYTIENTSEQSEAFYAGELTVEFAGKNSEPRETIIDTFSCQLLEGSAFPYDQYALSPDEKWIGNETLGSFQLKEFWDPLETKGDWKGPKRIFKFDDFVLYDQKNSPGCSYRYYLMDKESDGYVSVNAKYCTGNPNPHNYHLDMCEKNKDKLNKVTSSDPMEILESVALMDLYHYCQEYDFLNQKSWQGCLDAEPVVIKMANFSPAEGRIQDFYENEKIYSERHYKNGQLDGLTKLFHKNGNIWKERQYKADQLHGTAKDYFKSGALEAELTFQKGRLDGFSRYFYESGKIKEELNFKNGQLSGRVNEYFEDGKLKSQLYFRDGERQVEKAFLAAKEANGIGIAEDTHHNAVLEKTDQLISPRPIQFHEKLSLKELDQKASDLYSIGLIPEAVFVSEKALQLAKTQYGDESLNLAQYYGNLGGLYHLIGQNNDGEKFIEKARAIRDKHGQHGTPLGLQTEAFFDQMAWHKGGITSNDIHYPSAENILEKLVLELNSGEPYRIQNASRKLGLMAGLQKELTIDTSIALEPLMNGFILVNEEDALISVISALKLFNPELTLARLSEHLSNSNPDIRYQYVLLMSHIAQGQNDKIISSFAQAMSDKDSKVRNLAYWGSLFSMSHVSPRFLALFIKGLKDEDLYVRLYSQYALKQLLNAENLPDQDKGRILKALDDQPEKTINKLEFVLSQFLKADFEKRSNPSPTQKMKLDTPQKYQFHELKSTLLTQYFQDFTFYRKAATNLIFSKDGSTIYSTPGGVSLTGTDVIAFDYSRFLKNQKITIAHDKVAEDLVRLRWLFYHYNDNLTDKDLKNFQFGWVNKDGDVWIVKESRGYYVWNIHVNDRNEVLEFSSAKRN